MAVLSKPIPPLYTVYILRSTVRHSSLYIGSTPHPPRRLKQHNGDAKGGAVRTSRNTLRPWEMVGLVSGFPGSVAALKFEWALTNPHLSLHIPSESRITITKEKKRNGHPKRPQPSLTSIISNLHLLLRVPSFARWPLKLHFFAPDVYRAWTKRCATADEQLRDDFDIVTDFAPATSLPVEVSDEPAAGNAEQAWGIHAVPLDYAPMREYVRKTQNIFAFEGKRHCIICGKEMPLGEGLYATCPERDCEGLGHLSCWSRHLLGKDTAENIMPVTGYCPKCKGKVSWGYMMRETTLRVRGQKEITKLLKPRKRKAAVIVEDDS